MVNWEKTSYKTTVILNMFIFVVLILTVVLTLYLTPQTMSLLGEPRQLFTIIQLQTSSNPTSTTPDTSTWGFIDLRWYDKILVLVGFTLGFLIIFLIIGMSLYFYKVTRIKWVPIGLSIFLGVLIFGLALGYQQVRTEGIYYELLLRFSGWVSNLITFGIQNLLIAVIFVGIGVILMRESMKKSGLYPI